MNHQLAQIEQLIVGGRFDQALPLLNTYLSQDEHYVAYLYRGIVHQQGQRLEDAVADFSRALEVNPRCASAYANRGSTFDLLGRPDQAIMDHNQAIKLEPAVCEHYYNRGLAYVSKNDHRQAVEDFTSALELNSDYQEAYQRRALCYRALGLAVEAAADEKAAKQATAQNFSSTVGPGFGCLAKLVLLLGAPLGMGIWGGASWPVLLGMMVVITLADGVLSRMQTPAVWRFRTLVVRACIYLPMGALFFWLGGLIGPRLL